MGRTKKEAQRNENREEAQAALGSSEPAKSTEAAAKGQPAAAADKPAAAADFTKKRAKEEIDEIFGKSMKKAPAAAAAANAEEDGDAAAEAEAAADPGELQKLAKQVEEARQKAKRPKVEGSKDDIFGESSGKARKRTEEGYVVYGEDELGLGKKGGGDTPLCPFDCDCCY